MGKVHETARDGGGALAIREKLVTLSKAGAHAVYRRRRDLRVVKMLNAKGEMATGSGGTASSGGSSASGSVTPGSYDNGDGSKEFLSTGRTGRRNALPDILGRHAETGMSDLADRFEELSTAPPVSDRAKDATQPGTSKQRTG